jgi:Tol biopolymer transport system component
MTTGTLVGYQLGSYVIRSLLGHGGMGEVYQAEDTRLGRTVAIKVLPPSLRDDPERRQRFEREAKALAAISHPHICPLFDVGSQDGTDFLVMEYLEGETLAARLDRGRLPIGEVLRHAIEIADGLAAAHRQRVVHRDLKPGNIMLTRNGAKLLDFGLATRRLPEAAGFDTVSADTLTLPGFVLGTPRYMAPEQLEGKEADHRTDIFAFGAILYEMATGTRAFDGKSAAGVIAAIIEREPTPMAEVQPLTPPALDRLVRTCLAKDPDQRWQSVADLARELRSIAGSALHSGTPAADAGFFPRRASPLVKRIAPVMTTLAVLLLAAFAVLRPDRDREPTVAGQPTLDWRPFAVGLHQSEAVFSPDGKTMAVATKADRFSADPWRVQLRSFGSDSVTPLTDGRWNAAPLVWTLDNTIFFATEARPAGVWTMSAQGRSQKPILSMPWDVARRNVAVSPDGAAMVYVAPDPAIGGLRVWIRSPIEAEPRPYAPLPPDLIPMKGGGTIRFAPDGRKLLLWAGGGTMWVLPYPDGSALAARVPGTLPAAGIGFTFGFSWMPDGRRAIVSATADPEDKDRLHLLDTRTGETHLFGGVGHTAQYGPVVSPDGDTAAFADVDSNHDVVSVNVHSRQITELDAVNGPRRDEMPAWSANGAMLALVTNRNGPSQILLHRPGGGPDRLLAHDRFPTGKTIRFVAPTLSPDARFVVYVRHVASAPGELWISSVENQDAPPVRLVRRDVNDASGEVAGSWSPQGDRFAYWRVDHRNPDPKRRVLLMTVRTEGLGRPKELIAASAQGHLPVWSPTGDWILYGDNGLKLISPTGGTPRDLGILGALCTFSHDGRRLYCFEANTAQTASRRELYSVNLEGKDRQQITVVPSEYVPSVDFPPGRLSLGPDGHSVTYSKRRIEGNLGLIRGLAAYCEWRFGESCTRAK